MSYRLNSGPSGLTVDSTDGPSVGAEDGVSSWDHDCDEAISALVVMVGSFAGSTAPTVTADSVSMTLEASQTTGSGFWCWVFSLTTSVPQGSIPIVVTQAGGGTLVTGHSYAVRSAGAVDVLDSAAVNDSGTTVELELGTSYRPARLFFFGLSSADDPSDVDGSGSDGATLDVEVDIGSSVLVMGYSDQTAQDDDSPTIGVTTTGSESFVGVGIALGEVLTGGDRVTLSSNLPDSDAFTLLVAVSLVNERPGTFRSVLSLEAGTAYEWDHVGVGWVDTGDFVGWVDIGEGFVVLPTAPPVDGTPVWVAITRSGTGANNTTFRWRLHSGGPWVSAQGSGDDTWVPAVANVGNNSWGEWCDGRFQCARVWGAALSEGDLDAEIASATAVRTADLISDCPLGANANDVSGEDNHRSASGGAWAANFLTFDDPDPDPEPGDGGEAVSAGAHLTLWTDLPSEGGTLIAYVGAPYRVAGGRWSRRLTNDHEMTFGVVWTAPWVDELRRGRVLRLATRGEVWWWTILHVSDEMETPVKHVYAVGIEDRLRAMGPLAVSATGQRTYYSAGYIDLVPHQALDTFILPHLTREGWTGIGRGQIDSLMQHEQAWALQSAREIFDQVGVRVGCEVRLRYDTGEQKHLLEVLDEIGADSAPVLVSQGRNLRRLSRTQGRGDFATALIPQGDSGGGTGERASIAEASWYVSAKAGDVLTLGARDGGNGPIAFDGQWNGCTLLTRAATFVGVVSTDAGTQEVTLESGGGSSFSLGDDVVFFADDQGTPVTELSNPAAVAAYGREALTKAYEGYRGERQHVSNPFFGRWENKPDAVPCMTNGTITQSSSPVSASFDGLPSGRVVSAGDVFFFVQSSVGVRGYRVTVGDTADGSGEVTVTLAGNPLGGVGVADNQRCYHCRQAGRRPAGWGGNSWIMSRPAAGIDATGAVAQTYVDSYEIEVKDLDVPDGTEIAFGDLLETGSADRIVIVGGTVSGGSATVWIDMPLSQTEDAAVTIKRPSLTGGAAYLPIMMSLPSTTSGGIAPEIDSDSWTWRHRDGMLPAYFSCAVAAYRATGGGSPITYPTFSVRTTGGSTLESVQHPGGSDPLLLSVGVDLSADTSLLARLRCATDNGGTSRLFTIPIRCYAFEAPDETTPPVDGSWGTELAQRGNIDLRRLSVVPHTYQAECVDLSELSAYAAEWERVTLGGRIWLRAEPMGVADTPRVVELHGSLDDPRNTQYTLGTRPDLASRQFARIKPLPPFIAYQPEDADGESVRAGNAAMPTKVQESPRAVGAPGAAPSTVPTGPTPEQLRIFEYNTWLAGKLLNLLYNP